MARIVAAAAPRMIAQALSSSFEQETPKKDFGDAFK